MSVDELVPRHRIGHIEPSAWGKGRRQAGTAFLQCLRERRTLYSFRQRVGHIGHRRSTRANRGEHRETIYTSRPATDDRESLTDRFGRNCFRKLASGFVDIPLWVTEGYGTVFEEVDDELDARGEGPPDVVIVPLGTGALAAAAGGYYRVEPGVTATGNVRRFATDLVLLGAEPVGAACFAASAEAGERRSAPTAAPSVLGGLARGLPSPLAWEVVAPTFDGFVGIDDTAAEAAVQRLRANGVEASPAGAAAFAALDVVRAAGSEPIGPDARVLVVCTEGPRP